MSKEEWRDVVGYKSIYQVSNYGRVMRISHARGTTPGRILKPVRGAGGYLQVSLCRDGKQTNVYVHRLVAKAFLEKPSPDHNEVNHKNGDKADNRVENLEWVTPSQNAKHAFRILGIEPPGLKGEDAPSAKLTRREVKRIRELYATGEYTQRELGEMFGITHTNISCIIRRKVWRDVGGPVAPEIDHHACGEDNGRSKLTRHDVKRIRQLYATSNHTYQELGEMFGIASQHIGSIVRRKVWRHVP